MPHRFAPMARAARPALFLVLVIALAMLIVQGLNIRQALGDLRGVASDNLQWNLSQLEVDLLRLNEEIRVESLEGSGSLTELRKRFDLFYSRAQNAIGGKGYSVPGLEEFSKPMADTLNTYLTRETPLIDGPDQVLRENLPAMAERLAVLREEVRATSIKLIERMAQLDDNRRAAFSLLIRRMGVAMATTIGLLVCLLALVQWLNLVVTRQSRHTEQVSRRLTATVDSALDAIIVADDRGRIIQYNPSAESIFGFSRDEVMARDLDTLFRADPSPATPSEGTAPIAGGIFGQVNSGRFQTTAMDRSGREFPVEISISTAEGDDGRIFIAFLRDISVRLTAEAELTKARDDALAAERAKTEFLAVMSHEMRTPLNGVIASLEIAARKATDPEQGRFIALAQDSANLMLRHANDVLDVTRIESGGLRLTAEEFDLSAHLSGLVEGVRPICDARGIALDFQMLTGNALLKGDPFRLGQIVQNFLSNAIKFVQTGRITVEAEQTEAARGLRMVEIRVIDTGPGIASEDQQRIFDDFVMLDPSFQRFGGGAGLGLAISRRLAKAMGGEIGVESEPGEGSCFWLRVPFAPAQWREADTDAALEPKALAPMDVLVVEDNATNRAVMEEMLRHLGQSVTMASDGASGAAEAAARRFDLILMDISMPVMDGLAAARLIRQGGASRLARIVAVTAHSLPSDLERCRAAGMDDILVKPISNDRLIQVLSGKPGKPSTLRTGLIDSARIADLKAAVGAETFSRLARTFLKDGAAQKGRALAAASPGVSGEDLVAICHEAAGTAAVFGASRLSAHYAKAELDARNGQATTARQSLLRETETLWGETEAAVAALI